MNSGIGSGVDGLIFGGVAAYTHEPVLKLVNLELYQLSELLGEWQRADAKMLGQLGAR